MTTVVKRPCARCQEPHWPLVTRLKICLLCLEELMMEGGKWSTGDDSFLTAAQEFVEEQHGRKAKEGSIR